MPNPTNKQDYIFENVDKLPLSKLDADDAALIFEFWIKNEMLEHNLTYIYQIGEPLRADVAYSIPAKPYTLEDAFNEASEFTMGAANFQDLVPVISEEVFSNIINKLAKSLGGDS